MSRQIPPRRVSAQSLAKPAVGYVRVSRDEQVRDGVSLEAQRARITAYADAKNLSLDTIYADEGFSGRGLDRPGFQRLLRRCESGQVGHVIVWRLDRLTRRTRDLLSLVEDLFLARSIELHSVSESLDTATPHGRFVLTLFGGLAQMERELVAERTLNALAWKREQGLPTSHPPLGFRSVGKREPMEPVADELEIVRRILTLWRGGLSYRSIAASLNAEGVRTKRGATWHHTTVAKVVAARDRYAALLAA
jgi:DNA invertase Pin-like site-specific DNA recombinase